MKTDLKSNFIVWLFAFYAVGYVALYFFAGYAVTAYVISALLFGLAAVVFFDWFLTMIGAIRSGGRTGEAILAFCMCVMAIYGVHTRVWAIWRVALSFPDWTDTSPIGQSAAVWLLIFFSGVILATGTRSGEFPTRSFWQYGIALFLAGLFTGATVVLAFRANALDTPERLSTVQIPALPCPPEKPVVVRSYCRALPGKLTTASE